MSQTLEQMAAESGPKKPPVKPTERASTAEQLIAADSQRRERERLSKRKEVRQQIKQRAVLMQQVEDLESQLRLLDEKADAAAGEHQAACEPLQEALASATGSKRAKLLAELADANLHLQGRLDVVNRCRGPLLKQHRDVRSAAAGLPTEQRLAGADLASPLLRVEQFVAEQRLAAAEGRIERAREWVGTYDSQLQMASSTPTRPVAYGWIEERGKISLDFERIALLSFRLSKWWAELTDAESERHECMSELQRINKEAIAE